MTGGGWGDSGRGEAGLGVGKGGGGAGEGARTRNRGMVAGGGRSTEGATVAREHERSSSLVDVRRRKEDMTGGSHKEVIYLDVNWADRPPLPSGPSVVFLGVT